MLLRAQAVAPRGDQVQRVVGGGGSMTCLDAESRDHGRSHGDGIEPTTQRMSSWLAGGLIGRCLHQHSHHHHHAGRDEDGDGVRAQVRVARGPGRAVRRVSPGRDLGRRGRAEPAQAVRERERLAQAARVHCSDWREWLAARLPGVEVPKNQAGPCSGRRARAEGVRAPRRGREVGWVPHRRRPGRADLPVRRVERKAGGGASPLPAPGLSEVQLQVLTDALSGSRSGWARSRARRGTSWSRS